MSPDELLQAFRLTNPGEFHRQLCKIHSEAMQGDSDSERFLHELSKLLLASKRKPAEHAQQQ